MAFLKIGTRGSDLALWQSNWVKRELEKLGHTVELVIFKTQGDVVQHLSFDKMEGKAFFTKELEEALLENKINLAVHSYKDLETVMPKNLVIAATTQRHSSEDILIIKKKSVDKTQFLNLKKHAIIGTSSLRRKALVALFKDDCTSVDIRGNVPTRIEKLRQQPIDAIILAKAGVERLQLDLSDFDVVELPSELFISAAAQGVLALQCRENDKETIAALNPLNYLADKETTRIERTILNRLEGGCRFPIGVFSKKTDNNYHVWAMYTNNMDKLPKRVYGCSENADQLIDKVVHSFKKNIKYSVFISRDIKESTYFTKILSSQGHKVNAVPLTKYEKVNFEKVPNCSWLFFSSKNCVNYFFSQQPILPKDVKFGTIGGATAEALKKLGYTANFTGLGPDTVKIGKEFASKALNEVVVFPMSTASYRTIQKQFPSQQNLIDLIVYTTIPIDNVELPDADVVVLTSPTNALCYLRKKNILPDTVFVAMGKSTAEILQQVSITNYILPWDTTEVALADAVMSI